MFGQDTDLRESAEDLVEKMVADEAVEKVFFTDHRTGN